MSAGSSTDTVDMLVDDGMCSVCTASDVVVPQTPPAAGAGDAGDGAGARAQTNTTFVSPKKGGCITGCGEHKARGSKFCQEHKRVEAAVLNDAKRETGQSGLDWDIFLTSPGVQTQPTLCSHCVP